jgi:Putative transposase/Transposase zinc-binding domain
MLRNQSLKQILLDTREVWDHNRTRPAVRNNFLKVIDCGTPALGAEHYASKTEQVFVYHTCKSKACPSCGYRATGLWQEELEAALPDIRYVGINFTMPSVFREIFQQNRHLLNDLSAIAASALQRWAENDRGVSVLLIVVPQTFGGLLNFNPHLHMLVSAGGLQESESRWIGGLRFNKSEIMQMWRLALIVYLWVALRVGALTSDLRTEDLKRILKAESERDWIIYIGRSMAKSTFTNYAGRYIRRPPVPLNHVLKTTNRQVLFLAKDTRGKRKVELLWPEERFVASLGEHVSD